MQHPSLPIVNTLFRAALLPLVHIKVLLRQTYPYILISLATVIFLDKQEPTLSGWWILIFSLVGLLTAVWAGVNCHRIFLLPKEKQPRLKAVDMSVKHFDFLIAILRLGLATVLLCVPYFFLLFVVLELLNLSFSEALEGSQWLMQVLLLPVGYFIGRWMLILPDAAVGENRSFAWSWQVTRGHRWSVYLLLTVIPMMVALVMELAHSLFEASVVVDVVFGVLSLITAVIGLCLLSLTYSQLIDKSNHKQA